LTRTGKLCDDDRQEFILLSDVLGVTTRVDLINHRFPAGATEHSVLGPFFVADRPAFDNGADITNGVEGQPLLVSCRVLDSQGKPVAGARVDIWHSDDSGYYDILMPNRNRQGRDRLALRGLFRSDADGRFWFTSIVPASYPIPTDGTVGELLNAAGRSPVRPAHLHVRIEAPGYERLTTMLFVAGDKHLDSDPVFGVKSSLIVPFKKLHSGQHAPDGAALPAGGYGVSHDFVLTRTPSKFPPW
jgi:hydroxyquinol 1,2-dioxygenase